MEETDSHAVQASSIMLCPLCGGGRHTPLPFEYAFKGRSLGGVKCLDCAMVFVSPQPSTAEITEMYDESYFNSSDSDEGAHGNRAYMESAQESGESRTETAVRLDSLLQHREPRGTFLEIGCGPGFFLREMRAVGWTVRGLELSEYAVDYARNEFKLDVRRGAVAPEHFEPGSVDVVFLGDVLEHLAHPVEDLEMIHRWLRPGGQLAVAVPSTLNLWSASLGFAAYRALGRRKVLRIPPYHLLEFVPLTLSRMLVQAGYEVESLDVTAVPVRKMGLRGHPVENTGKVALQLFAHATSKLFNRWGDRILAVATKV